MMSCPKYLPPKHGSIGTKRRRKQRTEVCTLLEPLFPDIYLVLISPYLFPSEEFSLSVCLIVFFLKAHNIIERANNRKKWPIIILISLF